MGQTPAMVKLTFCLRRRPEMTLAEFQRYWREVHAPLVAERAEVLGILRYQQVHTLDQPELHERYQARNGGAPAAFDGVAEIWLESLDRFRGNRSEEARRAGAELLADERNFIDLPNSPMWLGEEHEIVPRRGV